VALGYKQIKGIDYDDNYSPVVKDICHRVLMARILKEKKWKKTLADVETAFLYGLLESQPGYEIIRNEMKQNQQYKDNMEGGIYKGGFVQLEKTIYGLVQAARA